MLALMLNEHLFMTSAIRPQVLPEHSLNASKKYNVFHIFYTYSRLLRSFTARGSMRGGPTKGLRLISSRVTELSQRYNKNTCLTLVKQSFISSLRLAAVLRSGKTHENNFYIAQVFLQNICLFLRRR